MLLREVAFIQILASIINQVAASSCGNCAISRLPSHDGFFINTFTWNTLTPDRVSCLWECYRRPLCRSFQYEDLSGECRGYSASLRNDDSYSGTFVGGDIMTYGLCEDMVLPVMVVPQSIGSPCTTTDDCFVANSSCVYGQCTCVIGLSYNKNDSTCGVYCQNYGTDFGVYPGFSGTLSSDYVVGPRVNASEDCKNVCLGETSFVSVVVWADEIGDGLYQCEYGSETWEMPGSSVDYMSYAMGVLYVRNCA